MKVARADRGLPPFRIEVHFAQWEFVARHHLAASDAQTVSVQELLHLAEPADRADWDRLQLGYTPTRGAPELREVIASTYETAKASDVICFAGAEEGIWCLMHALLEPTDHAVVVVPNYQSAESIPAALCQVTGVAMRPPNWLLDLDELKSAIRPNTKLMAVNFPNNPTGSVPEAAVFAGLVSLCSNHGIFLFSDEVYRGLERDPAKRLPQACDLYERGLSLNVMSKSYGLPGLRLGWIMARDHDLLERMERHKHYLSICNPGPSELLGRIAIKAREKLHRRNLELCATNLQALGRFFAAHLDLYEWEEPPGACVGFPRYKGSDGVESHCQMLLEDAGVLLLPASIFASRLAPVPDDRFRIGFGRFGLDQGLAAWEDCLGRQ